MGSGEYRVISGDTLSSIARRNRVTVELLSRLNGLSELNGLRIGQVLQIPKAQASHAPPPVRTYRVRADDTLPGIAERFKISVEALCQANGLQTSAQIRIGQELKIPHDPGASNTPKTSEKTPGTSTPSDSSQKKSASTQVATARKVASVLGTVAASVDQSKFPKDLDEVRKLYPNVDLKATEDVEKVFNALLTLANPTASLWDKLSAIATLLSFFPKTLEKALQDAGVKDKTVLEIAGNEDLIEAVSTLFNTSATIADRIVAGFTLAMELHQQFSGKALTPTLKKLFEGLPTAAELANSLAKAVDTLLDPKLGVLDKAEAVFSFLSTAKAAAGTLFPKLVSKLRATNSSLAVLRSVLTLLDPNASLLEKGEAAWTLFANAGDLGKDLKKMKAWLTQRGVPNAEAIIKEVEKLRNKAGNKLATEGGQGFLKQLDPKVVQGMSGVDTKKLLQLSQNAELKAPLEAVFKVMPDASSAHHFLEPLAKAEGAVQKEVLALLSGMDEEVLKKILATSSKGGKPLVAPLIALMVKLPATARGSLTKLVKEFDEQALKIFLPLTEAVDGKIAGEAIEHLSKIDSKNLGKALVAVESLLGKLGLRVTREIGTTILKGLVKMFPAVGAIVSAKDVVANTGIALDAKLPPEVRYLASQCAYLNAVDTVLGILEFLGVGNVAFLVNIALGLGELALELVIASETARFKANQKGYKATDLVDGIIVGTAIATFPAGIGQLVLFFGIEGSVRKILKGIKLAGRLGVEIIKVFGKTAADMTARLLEFAANVVDLLADMLRNPEKYATMAREVAENAVKRLVELGEKGGELARKAWDALRSVTDDLYKLGERGLERLKWIAQHPGEVAEKALDAIKNLIDKGGEKLLQLGLAALGELEAFYQDVRGGIRKGFEKVANKAKATFNLALKKGKACVDALFWVANNPKHATKQALHWAKGRLVHLVSTLHDLKNAAMKKLLDLGKEGLEYTKDAINYLKAKGQQGLELITWVAENPGKAAQEVIKASVGAIKALASGVSEVAKRASETLVRFFERIDDAGKRLAAEAEAVIDDFIKRGHEAGEYILDYWKTRVSPAAKRLFASFKNLGAAGAELLGRIVAKGGQLIDAGLEQLQSMLKAGAQAAFDVLDRMVRQGGELFGRALDALKNFAPVQFTSRVFNTLLDLGKRGFQEAKLFVVRNVENAFRIVSDAYTRGGLAEVARLIVRTGLDIGSQLLSVLWDQRKRISKALDSIYDFAKAFVDSFSFRELAVLLDW